MVSVTVGQPLSGQSSRGSRGDPHAKSSLGPGLHLTPLSAAPDRWPLFLKGLSRSTGLPCPGLSCGGLGRLALPAPGARGPPGGGGGGGLPQLRGARLGALSHAAAPHLLSDSGRRSGCSVVARPPSPELQAGPKPVTPVPRSGQQLPRPLPPSTCSLVVGGGGAWLGPLGAFRAGGAGMGRQEQPGRPHPPLQFPRGRRGGNSPLHPACPCRGLCWGAELVEASREAGQRDREPAPAVECRGPGGPPLPGALRGYWELHWEGVLPSVGPRFPHPSKRVP